MLVSDADAADPVGKRSHVERVFISYAREDRARVDALRRLILRFATDVFVDYDGISAGDRWEPILREKLKFTDVLILFWTRYAIDRPYVRMEYEIAVAEGVRILPLLGDNTPLPAPLQEFQAIEGLALIHEILHEQTQLLDKGIPPKEVARRIRRMLEERGITLTSADKRAIRMLVTGTTMLMMVFTALAAGLLILILPGLILFGPYRAGSTLVAISREAAAEAARLVQQTILAQCRLRALEAEQQLVEVIATKRDAPECVASDAGDALDMPVSNAAVRASDSDNSAFQFGGRNARSPTIRMAKSVAQQGIDRDAVHQVVRSHFDEVRYCYNSALALYPESSGKIMVDFIIGPEGRVGTSRITSDDTRSDGLVGECILKAFRRWQFPVNAGHDNTPMSYPFVFDR